MEEQEDFAELLRETLEGFNIDWDLKTIDLIAKGLKSLQSEREQRIHTEQRELQLLSQNLEEQKELLQGAESSKHRTDMKSKIKENQNTELGLHKSLKELTSNKQELSTSLSALVDEFNSLEKQIVDLDYIEEDEDKDAIVYPRLKLLVYRKLGIKIDMKSSIMIIFNKEKNLTDFLNYGDDKYSDYFISNYVWDRL